MAQTRTIYCVHDGRDVPVYCPTMTSAMAEKARRDIAHDAKYGPFATIDRIKIGIDRRSLCDYLNRVT